MNPKLKVLMLAAVAVIVGLSGFIAGFLMAEYNVAVPNRIVSPSTSAPDELGSRVEEVNQLLQSRGAQAAQRDIRHSRRHPGSAGKRRRQVRGLLRSQAVQVLQ